MTQVYDILDKVRDRLRDNPNVFTVTFGALWCSCKLSPK